MQAEASLSPLDSLNAALQSAGNVRAPRCTVTVNGVPLTGVLEVEVTNASHFTADTYRVVASASGLTPGYGPDYWALSSGDRIGISVAFAAASASQLILGDVDDVEYDPVRRTITLTGRDLSAPLIDTKTAEKFQNRTSSQIAEALAARHGLSAQAQKTTVLSGTYYSIDHVTLTHEQTEWDLLVFLATQEGFDLWVSGQTLYFQPSPVPTATPYKIVCPKNPGNASNAVDVKISRSQTLAKDVIVIIQSWNQKQQKSFKVQYHVSQAFKSARSGGKAQVYSYVVPNLTRDQALKLAQARAEDITRHEKVLAASLPGDNLLTTRAPIQLTGTGTAWDQTYYPDTVTRRFSAHEGYRMDLRAKNHSTQSTVALG